MFFKRIYKLYKCLPAEQGGHTEAKFSKMVDYYLNLNIFWNNYIFDMYLKNYEMLFISCVFEPKRVEHNKVDIQRQKSHCGTIIVYLERILK